MRYLTLMGWIAICLATFAQADTTYKNIVAVSTKYEDEARQLSRELEARLLEDTEYQLLRDTHRFELHARPSGRLFVVTLEPFRNDSVMYKILHKVQQYYPDSFVYTHWASASEQRVSSATGTPEVIILRADPITPDLSKLAAAAGMKKDTTAVPIAILLLSVVILMALYVFWQQQKLSKARREQLDEKKKLAEIIEQQEDILVNVSQKIQTPAREIGTISEKILRTELSALQVQGLTKIRHSDELLLDITNDLIDFLNLKSGSLSVNHDVFNVNNVLDELAGQVSARSRGSDIELIFDIEKGVPSRLIGDSLRLGQVLTSLLSTAMDSTRVGEVRMNVRRIEGGKGDVGLVFEIIDTGFGYEPIQLERLFEPFSDTGGPTETGMRMYIARELILMMHGTIEVSSKLGHGSTFVITLHFDMPDPREKRHYRLPSRDFIEHTYLIIDMHPSAAEALKKMLEYFKNNVTVRSITAIENNTGPLFSNEVIIIAEDAFTAELVSLVEKIRKREEAPRIVLAGNMMAASHALGDLESLIDARIMKPLNLQRVYDLIVDLFDDDENQDATKGAPRYTQPTAVKSTDLQIQEIQDTPGVTKESFAIFQGAKLLIVEDNMINQKVILGLLRESGIDITVADNGLIALETVEEQTKRFDLVLMDINMPVMDGYESTKHIRANPAFNDLPIVSLTGLGLAEEIAKMYGIGMNAHLIKPLQIGQLYTIFIRYLPHGDIKPEIEKTQRVYNESEVLKISQGLRCASEDETLYQQILEQFVLLYAGSDDSITTLRKADDLEGIRSLCLDVKGVTANIGAEKLCETATRIHEAISQKDVDTLDDSLETYNTDLHAVLKAIRHYLT